MPVLGEVAAFIDIGAESTGEGEIRHKQTQERKRDPVEDFPAVLRVLRTDIKQFLHVFPVQGCAVLPPVTEADIQASVRIDFKIEISVFLFRHKEKFQTAVQADRGEGDGIFRTDVFFDRAQMNVEGFRTVAELAESTNAAVGSP